ncbi:MAG: hypothetical protein KJ592_04080 [Nanoarchaeota archaeon]|nr:hypothetical protein [Nanoarchaeota archaeon]
MITIGADFVLASLLYRRDNVTGGEIKKYTCAIYDLMRKRATAVYVESSGDDILAELDGTRDVYRREDDGSISKGLEDSYFERDFIVDTLSRRANTSERGMDKETSELVFALAEKFADSKTL